MNNVAGVSKQLYSNTIIRLQYDLSNKVNKHIIPLTYHRIRRIINYIPFHFHLNSFIRQRADELNYHNLSSAKKNHLTSEFTTIN